MIVMGNRSLTDQFQLRLPDGMRDEIKAAAAREGRSMTGQIVHHLREVYGPDGRDPQRKSRSASPRKSGRSSTAQRSKTGLET